MGAGSRGSGAVLRVDTAWMRRARCRGLDPEQFFVRTTAQSKTAVNVCQGCPVKSHCLQYALDHDIDFGIWGGLTARQRRRLARTSQAT